jgi:hypothetical protein
LDRLKKENISYGSFWLDIEIRAWPADQAANRKFITDMINGAKVKILKNTYRNV